MEHIAKELREDYERWLIKIGDDPYSGKGTVGIKDVLRAHYLIVDYFSNEYGGGIGGIGPRDLNLLHSALNRQTTGYDSHQKWNSEFEICATLFYGLIKDHAFHDANKRTAFLTLLYHLRKIDRTPDARQKEFETLALRIASNQLEKYSQYTQFKLKRDGNIYFIADFLRRNTRKVNKNEYIITYRDLDTILKKYSYNMANPNKNHIEIVHNVVETTGLFKKETRTIEKRVGVIDFPGWGRQICLRDIKFVRKITGLIHENGVDSEAFFHNAEPFAALIWQFQNPLKRLADK